jgi:hypothetical protein
MATQRVPFNTIDTVIVASASVGHISNDVMVLRQVMRGVVQDLYDVSEDDVAEDFCQLLDNVMVEYLITLKEVILVTVTTLSLSKVLSALEDDKDTGRRIGIPLHSSEMGIELTKAGIQFRRT